MRRKVLCRFEGCIVRVLTLMCLAFMHCLPGTRSDMPAGYYWPVMIVEDSGRPVLSAYRCTCISRQSLTWLAGKAWTIGKVGLFLSIRGCARRWDHSDKTQTWRCYLGPKNDRHCVEFFDHERGCIFHAETCRIHVRHVDATLHSIFDAERQSNITVSGFAS